MSTEFSHLSEQVDPDLLSDAQTYSVVLIEDGQVAGQVPSVKLQDPYALDLTQFIPNPPVKFEQFIELLSEVINDAQTREKTVESERVKLVQEYQPDQLAALGDEVITYKLISRGPAKMNRSGTGRPNRGFSHQFEYQDPTQPNKFIAIESRPLDHIVEVAAWGKTALLANRRALWLERLLISQRWAFTSKGVNPFYFEKRGADTVWKHAETLLHQRPIQFKARMSEYLVLAHPTLRAINLELKTNLS